ncbi:MAG: methyltransferase domain-containing protein, partial [Candidatus Liptonbacteria bacterium]|nr:methyltransferase domain-containing protein [Candidatus Liptonbacteria bacterium]
MKKQNDTSWGIVADWYHEHLSASDTHHEKVILPNLARILQPKNGERILDAACGEGFFSRALASNGAGIIGVDISPELIAIAKKLSPDSAFHAAPLADLSFAK